MPKLLVILNTLPVCGRCGDTMAAKWKGHGVMVNGMIWCQDKDCDQYRKAIAVYPSSVEQCADEPPEDA